VIELQIRKAVLEDGPGIVEIWKEFFDFHGARDPHYTRTEDGHELFGGFITSQMGQEESDVWVAVRDGIVVGYCLAKIEKTPPVFVLPTYGSIWDLAVTAGARRQGVGEALVRAVEAWFSENGQTRFETRLSTTNEVSTAFWAKMGYRGYALQVCKEAGEQGSELGVTKIRLP
jgi:ribosomal protein S18 acetylase RimI-like enzyme